MFMFFMKALIGELSVFIGKPGRPRTFAIMVLHNQKIGLGSIDASESTVSRQKYSHRGSDLRNQDVLDQSVDLSFLNRPLRSDPFLFPSIPQTEFHSVKDRVLSAKFIVSFQALHNVRI